MNNLKLVLTTIAISAVTGFFGGYAGVTVMNSVNMQDSVAVQVDTFHMDSICMDSTVVLNDSLRVDSIK